MAFHSRKLSTRSARSISRKYHPSRRSTCSAEKMYRQENTRFLSVSHCKAAKPHSPTHRSIISLRRLFLSSSTVTAPSSAKVEKRLRIVGGLLGDPEEKPRRASPCATIPGHERARESANLRAGLFHPRRTGREVCS